MKKVKAFCLHPITLSILGLIVLGLLVWFLGPQIKFGANNTAPLSDATVRLAVIMVILVLWGLNNLRIQAQTRKNNQELVDDIQGSQETAADMATGQAADEVHQINQRFVDALATLRNIRFKGATNKSRALYELPWYIIVGPPGAGKTTALVNSGLEFPLADQFGKGALQGVGGTRNCDWWFTNDAVLVDTAGRYTTQDSHRVVDSSAWEGFLNLLKRHRRRRPINGAIVSISVQDLLTQTEEERFQHAKTIRTRIDELMSKLEVRFPVYLVLTKTDLVSGFNEFFEDLGKEERDQVWGVSLPDAPEAEASPDFELLSGEFDNLAQRLYDRVLWRMHQERDVTRRAAIEQFPKQMEQVAALAQTFVTQAFSPNRYRYQPYLRGVYFSSGTQDGTPIDRLMSSLSSSFGISRDVSQADFQRGKSFFLGRLFRDVIFPESELVGTNRRYEQMRVWGRRGCYGVLGAVAVCLLAVWTGAVGRHASYMEDVRRHLGDFANASQTLTEWETSLRDLLPSMSALASASEVYDRSKHPWLSGMGLYDGRIDHSADTAYETFLRQDFADALAEHLETSLGQLDDDIALYNTFRVYRMFDQVDRMDEERVTHWFQSAWAEDRGLREQDKAALHRHLSQLMTLTLSPRELNETLVANVTHRLLQLPIAQRVYSRIRNRPEYRRPTDMIRRFGRNATSVFELDEPARQASRIPWFYTKDGYETIDLSSGSEVLRELVDDRWIFVGSGYTDASMEDSNLSDISEQVTDYYLSDYSSTWSNLFSAVAVTPFTSLRQASDVLGRVSDPVSSPVLSVLKTGAEQTQLTERKVVDAVEGKGRGRTGRAADYLASRFEGNRVDKRFGDLHYLMRETEKSPAPVGAVLDELRKLRSFVQEITMAPNPNQRAFEIAKSRYQSGAGNQMTSLRAYAKDMPSPLNRWLDSFANETWRVVLGAAHAHINQEWKSQVHRQYRRMASGRYPLYRNADSEMSVYEFSELFKPGGILPTFFDEYVKPFIATHGQWNNRSVDGYTLGLSSRGLAQLRHGLAITELFFRGGSESPRLSMDFQPRDMHKQVARFTLDMGSDRVSYNHGPKFWRTLDWSGADAGHRLRLIFEDLNGSTLNRSYRGPWSWFRALEDAQVRPTSRSNIYQLTFTPTESGGSGSDRPTIVYEVRTQSTDNLFNRNPLRLFSFPERL